MHVEPLIIDLAVILCLAAVTTVLFKWLKLPLVLGYIVAGYLASNHFEMTPTVTEVGEINTWAEIGVIFLLFRLGLDFSFKKLLGVGGASMIAAIVIVCGMMAIGFLTGKLMHWSTADSVFLGGMISMSSTTIIYKQLSDTSQLKLKFAGIVFGVLVVEDLFAIVMMVLLTTIYVSKSFSGIELGWSIVRLIFFLMVWFGVGIYLIPTILKKARRFLTGETLLLTSLGLCFSMVFLASFVGFSPALGAFIMGSILAETPEATHIEHQTKPISDLFGAIFFVSVGMMVNPEVVVEHWVVVLILTAVVVVGQISLAIFGVLLSGKPLRNAVRAAFSLGQIGEFSFIIAALGVTLGVTSSFLYPIIVTVSVLTIFLTPFIMRGAEPAIRVLERFLPTKFQNFIMSYTSGSIMPSTKGLWRQWMSANIKRIAIFSILLSGITWFNSAYILPFISKLSLAGWNDVISTAVSLIIISPFVWALTVKPIKPDVFVKLWTNSNFNRGMLISLILIRFAIAFAFVMAVLVSIHSYRWGTVVAISVLILVLLLFSKRIAKAWNHFEVQFRRNMDGNTNN